MAARGMECGDGQREGGERKEEEEEIRERTEGWWGPGVLILVSGRGAAARYSFCLANRSSLDRRLPMREYV